MDDCCSSSNRDCNENFCCLQESADRSQSTNKPVRVQHLNSSRTVRKPILGLQKQNNLAALEFQVSEHFFHNSAITKFVMCARIVVEMGSHLTKMVPIITQLFSQPKVAKSHCLISQEPLLYRVNTFKITEIRHSFWCEVWICLSALCSLQSFFGFDRKPGLLVFIAFVVTGSAFCCTFDTVNVLHVPICFC